MTGSCMCWTSKRLVRCRKSRKRLRDDSSIHALRPGKTGYRVRFQSNFLSLRWDVLNSPANLPSPLHRRPVGIRNFSFIETKLAAEFTDGCPFSRFLREHQLIERPERAGVAE